MQKNSSYHRIIKRSPYRSVFGVDPRMGLSNGIIPESLLQTIKTEEELELLALPNEQVIFLKYTIKNTLINTSTNDKLINK